MKCTLAVIVIVFLAINRVNAGQEVNFKDIIGQLFNRLKAIYGGALSGNPARHLGYLKDVLNKADKSKEELIQVAEELAGKVNKLKFNGLMKELIYQVQGETEKWDKYDSDKIEFLEEISDELAMIHNKLVKPIDDLGLVNKLLPILKSEAASVNLAKLSLDKYVVANATPAMVAYEDSLKRLRQVYTSVALKYQAVHRG